MDVLRIDPEIERRQRERVQAVRAKARRGRVARGADGREGRGAQRRQPGPRVIVAVEAYATVGEIADAMREVFGEYRESSLD